MEAGAVAPEQTAPTPVDVSEVHRLLDEAEKLFHRLLAGRGDADTQDDVARFTPHLNTVRMVADQAADLANKGH